MKKLTLHQIQLKQAKKVITPTMAVFIVSVVATILLRLQILSLAGQSVVNNSGAFRMLDILEKLTIMFVWINRLCLLILLVASAILVYQYVADHTQD